jgi:hypothetical protein
MIPKRTKNLLHQVIILIAGLLSALSAEPCPDRDDLKFLQGLGRERRYPLVAFQSELYRRSMKHCPQIPEIDLELGKALYQLGDFQRARQVLVPHVLNQDFQYRRLFLESYLLDFRNPEILDSSIIWLEAAAQTHSQPEEERRMFLAAAFFVQGRDDEARKAWPTPVADSKMCDAMGNPQCYLEAGFKHPWLAAGLSTLPGLGYVYAGQNGDGVFAFALTSLFYGVAIYYSVYDAPVRAWTFAGFGTVFHLSNIYGSHRAAKENNRRRKTAFLISLHKLMFP